MVKKSVWAVCSVALLAAAFALPASAQDIQGKGPVVAHATSMHVVVAPQAPPPATIFSNLGVYNSATCTSTPAYVGCAWEPYGYYVAGPTGAIATTQNIALPFTPKVNATMHHAEMPVQYAGSSPETASFTASVQADSAGVPSGVYLVSHHVPTAQVPTFWTCCSTGVAGGGVVVALTQALTGGTQYWLVADCNAAADTSTTDAWAATGVANAEALCVGTSPCSPYTVALFPNTVVAARVY
jgi:hypothetical protein